MIKFQIDFNLQDLLNDAMQEHGTTDGKRRCKGWFFDAKKQLDETGHSCSRCLARQKLRALVVVIKTVIA